MFEIINKMGSSGSKDTIAKLEELDRKEYDLNLQLKDLQLQLNKLVPENERIKVNKELVPNIKLEQNYRSNNKNNAKKNNKKDKGKAGKKKKK